MTTQQQKVLRGDQPATLAEKRQAVDKYPAQCFPIQHEIKNLQTQLRAFNERIAELKNDGRQSHAMDLLKTNALDLARQIDELRCLLLAPK